jgi:hypothetical protein
MEKTTFVPRQFQSSEKFYENFDLLKFGSTIIAHYALNKRLFDFLFQLGIALGY